MQARRAISIAQDRLRQLQEAVQEDMPANIAGLEASKKVHSSSSYMFDDA